MATLESKKIKETQKEFQVLYDEVFKSAQNLFEKLAKDAKKYAGESSDIYKALLTGSKLTASGETLFSIVNKDFSKFTAQYTKLEKNKELLNQWYEEQKLNAQSAIHNVQEYKEKILGIETELAARRTDLQLKGYDAMLKTGQTVFAKLAAEGKKYAGEDSGFYKAMSAGGQIFSILDNGISQFTSENEPIAEKKKQLEASSQENRLSAQKELAAGIIDSEAYSNRILEIEQNLVTQRTALQLQGYDAMSSAGQNVFANLTTLAKDHAGESSGIYKAMFATEKAFAIARSVIAIQVGIAEAATAPFPASILAMAKVLAATSSIVSTIQSVSMPSGMAHEGLERVPKTGTWLLEKGERVTTAHTSAKLDSTLTQIQNNQVRHSASPQNIRIINSVDPDLMKNYLGSSDGERMIMNVIHRNPSAIKHVVSA